jgi:hypothetical protein
LRSVSPATFHRGQAQRRREGKPLVGQNREWQVEALHHLPLIGGGLRRQAEHPIRAERPQFTEVVRKAQDCGVQPRAPGIPFQSGVSGGRPGSAVRG